MLYIIPSNFLFGASISNKIRKDFLPQYKITEAVIFEKKIFEFTGTNVIICFFERSDALNNTIEFDAVKINSHTITRHYVLSKKNKFRAENF
jgi:type I restriction-modification system DNA methylase subunit